MWLFFIFIGINKPLLTSIEKAYRERTSYPKVIASKVFIITVPLQACGLESVATYGLLLSTGDKGLPAEDY